MTPKEKAKELVYKYQYLVNTWDCYNEETLEIQYRLPNMKECALIAVNEMLEEYQSMSDLESKIVINNKPTFVVHQLIYWMEVKQEIEQL